MPALGRKRQIVRPPVVARGTMPPISVATPGPAWHRIFRGQHGWRAGWRLMFFVTATVAAGEVVENALGVVGIQEPNTQTASSWLWMALTEFAIVLAVVAMMARLERRSLAQYGLPLR